LKANKTSGLAPKNNRSGFYLFDIDGYGGNHSDTFEWGEIYFFIENKKVKHLYLTLRNRQECLSY